MSSPYPRDLIGYAGKPPNPKWPGDARLAINFVMNYEEGSEYSVPDGDGFSEATLTEVGRRAASRRHRARPGRRGHVRVRQPRRLLARDAELRGARPAAHRVRLRARPGAQSARRGGHPRGRASTCARTAGGGSSTTSSPRTRSASTSAARWRRSEQTTGERPLGWYCRYGPSVNTRRLLVEEGGFLYDSDAYNDELPYWVEVGGAAAPGGAVQPRPNDSKFGHGGFFTADDYFTYCKDGFDVLYREGRTQPKMMSVGLHIRLIGHPSRAAGLRARARLRHEARRRVGEPAHRHRAALDGRPSARVSGPALALGARSWARTLRMISVRPTLRSERL